ncbi:MAG: hypothetical protein JSV51_08280 [Candidatus Bathyarchaeota archaeon]|nr:MAG: hypothetical protein JSV51_08280 [Candidatus Bathyarchaeota archaeon]
MRKSRLLIILPSFLYLVTLISLINASTITGCTFDKFAYNQGETGYITVSIYNNEESKIRVTALTAAIDYYYVDGNTYLQTFYTDESLPIEIQAGETSDLQIPFSLPNNIAPGYTELHVKAITEQWNNHSQSWSSSDHPTYQPTLYIESPYKQRFEEQQATNYQLDQQILELEAINTTTTNIMYLLLIATIIFAVITIFLVTFSRKPKLAT